MSHPKQGAKHQASNSILKDLKGLKKLWPFLQPNKHLIIAAACLIPVISGLQMALPLVIRYAIDSGISQGDRTVIFTACAWFLALTIFEYTARISQSLSAAVAVHRMILLLRRKLITHVLHLPASYHDKTLSGTLVTRATSDFDNLSDSLNQGVLTSVIDLAVLLGSLGGLFLLDWRLALTTFLILPVVGRVVITFSKALKKAMLAARVKIASLNAYTQECLYGTSTIKLLTGEASAQKQYDILNLDYRNTQMRSVVLDAFMFATIDGIAAMTIGAILWVAISGFVGKDILTIGVMVAFVQYVQQLFEPLKQLGNKIAMLQGAFTAIERIFGVLNVKNEIAGDHQPVFNQGEISFQNVSFSYGTNESGQNQLEQLSFSVPSGTSMAIIGPTGSGKSTIVKLLSKFYSGYEGQITIDGHEVWELDGDHLRNHFAIVPQDIVIFQGSIAFNIGLDKPGITLEQIQEAAKTVGAHHFIERLPDQYNYQLQEQGQNLSHGQRQLIAFARALVSRPTVVILDEATSSVDSESEKLIQDAVSRILKDRTVIVIAHRLSTIKQCDQIMVIEKGRVMEIGDHSDLLARQGHYADLLQQTQNVTELG